MTLPTLLASLLYCGIAEQVQQVLVPQEQDDDRQPPRAIVTIESHQYKSYARLYVT
jgi:hypothetical protein